MLTTSIEIDGKVIEVEVDEKRECLWQFSQNTPLEFETSCGSEHISLEGESDIDCPYCNYKVVKAMKISGTVNIKLPSGGIGR